MSSPGFPGDYPYSLQKTETIKVANGKVLRIDFTHFDVFALSVQNSSNDDDDNHDPCPYDFVKITDGDGTILMNKSCGYSSADPSEATYFPLPSLMSKTNNVSVYFHTDDTGAEPGWNFTWRASPPGF